MKNIYKKIFVIGLLMLGLFSGINATLTDGNVAYWAMDNSTGQLVDSSGNGYSLTNSDATSTTGKLNEGFSFDGSSSKSYSNPIDVTNYISVFAWIKTTTNNEYGRIVAKWGAGDSYSYMITQNGANIQAFLHTSDNYITPTGSITINDGNWHYVGMVYNGNTLYIYVDGQLDTSQSLTGTIITDNTIKTYIGWEERNDHYYAGDIDEVGIWNRALSSTEISQLYNSGNGHNPYIIVKNPQINITNISLINNSYFNTSNINISIQLNTTATNNNTNISYSLNGNSYIQFVTNNLTGTLNLNNLNDDMYNISFYTWNNETNTTSQNYTFTIDTIKPTIINNISSEYNSYNITTNYSCNDTNLLYCNISINNQNTNKTNILLTTSGNLTYNIFTKDLAGNINSLINVTLINPYATLWFEDKNNNSISNFTLNKTQYTNPVKFKYYNNLLNIGNNSFLFEQLGYLTSNISFNLTPNYPALNKTFNIQNSKIVLSIYDGETGQLITDSTKITLIATNYTTTSTTGKINISQINFYDGEYQLMLESNNYNTENLYFNYNNKENLIVNAYMLKKNLSNLGLLDVKVQDSISPITNQLVNLMAWDTNKSAYIVVGQSKSDSNGDAFFNIQLKNKVYKVVSNRNGVIAETPEQVISLSGTIIYLIFSNSISPSVHYDGENIISSITNSTYNSTHDLIKFKYQDANNLVTKACINIYMVRGTFKTLLGAPTCVNSPSGEIQVITSNNNSYEKEVVGVAYIGDTSIKLDSITYQSNLTFESALGNLSKWIILILMLVVIALGVVLGNISILSISTIIMAWVVYSIFSTTLSYTIPLLITIVMILILWGTFKKRF